MAENAPNFYILLDLNPYDAWDADKFAEVLKEKRSQWSRESASIGPKALAAKKNLALLSDIEYVMGDRVQRALQAKSAKEILATKRQERLVEFERRLTAIEQKGYIESAEIASLVNDFKDVLTEREVIDQVKAHTSSVKPVEEVRPLETSVMEDIIEKLAMVNMSSLYQLLDLPPTASCTALAEAAENLFEEMMQRQPKTPEVIAQTKLASHARSIFSTEANRRRYDESLKQATPNIPTTPAKAPEASTQPLPPQELPTDIEGLTIQNLDTALRLRWVWPPDCYEALVGYSSNEWPQPDKGIGTILKVTRAEYEIGGHYDLRGPTYQPYNIVVVAIFRGRGGQVITQGARVQGYLKPRISVRYEIKNPRFGYKQRTLHLYTMAPGVLPTLLLVARRGGLPFTKTDGELLHRAEGPIPISGEVVIQLPGTPFTNTHGRLFLEDDDLYSVVTIYHPPEGKLRLGK
jgi:hypothetical protein